MERTVELIVVRAGNVNHAILHRDIHILMHCSGKGALRALNGDSASIDFHIDACWNNDWLSADT